MLKKFFSLTLIFISFSCFNNKLKQIKNFNFENLNTNPNVSQVNSKFIEGVSSKDFKIRKTDKIMVSKIIKIKKNLSLTLRPYMV